MRRIARRSIRSYDSATVTREGCLLALFAQQKKTKVGTWQVAECVLPVVRTRTFTWHSVQFTYTVNRVHVSGINSAVAVHVQQHVTFTLLANGRLCSALLSIRPSFFL